MDNSPATNDTPTATRSARAVAIDGARVAEIAYLARLEIGPEEAEHYADDLRKILQLVAELGEIPADQAPPLAHPLEISQRLRDDAVTEENQRERLLAVAPVTENGLYLVPRVIG